MADVNKMDRTWLCSVLFMDIAKYSSQSVELQMKWKARFNGYLAEAIRDVPESERVILDTGDGAAICFLGAPEAAMFAALQLCGSFVIDERERQPGLRVRLGINLGPVKLVKDINGALNAIGDGINAGQRIMSFASVNQILVSQSFFEVVSCLSDDYKPLFELKGVEKDKHVREHTVYHLTPPGTEKRPHAVEHADGRAITAAHAIPKTASSLDRRPPGRFSSWLIGGAALVVLAAVGIWRFNGRGTDTPAASNPAVAPVAESQTRAAKSGSDASASVKPTEPISSASVVSGPDKSASAPRPDATPAAKSAKEPVVVAKAENTPAPREASQPERAFASVSATQVSAEAKAAYDDASRLLDDDKPAEAAKRFDDAIRVNPNYIEAYVGRAEARRMMEQYDLSLEDCNNIIKIKADEPRGYNCRGRTYQLLKQYDRALPELDKAIQLNPNFGLAYDNRGDVYSSLQQYDRAVKDFNEAIRIRPRLVLFRMRRANAYSNLKQYDKAIQDYTEVIRLEPKNTRAYALRASVEDGAGDVAAAAADRRHVQESRQKKKE